LFGLTGHPGGEQHIEVGIDIDHSRFKTPGAGDNHLTRKTPLDDQILDLAEHMSRHVQLSAAKHIITNGNIEAIRWDIRLDIEPVFGDRFLSNSHFASLTAPALGKSRRMSPQT